MNIWSKPLQWSWNRTRNIFSWPFGGSKWYFLNEIQDRLWTKWIYGGDVNSLEKVFSKDREELNCGWTWNMHQVFIGYYLVPSNSNVKESQHELVSSDVNKTVSVASSNYSSETEFWNLRQIFECWPWKCCLISFWFVRFNFRRSWMFQNYGELVCLITTACFSKRDYEIQI